MGKFTARRVCECGFTTTWSTQWNQHKAICLKVAEQISGTDNYLAKGQR